MTIGPVYQGVAADLREAGVGPVYQTSEVESLRTGGGPPFGGAYTFGPTPTADLVSERVGRGYPEVAISYPRLEKTGSVDLTATPASTPIYTVPTGKTAIIHMVVLRCTAASGVTVVALAGVGVTGTDVYPDQQLLGLDAAGVRYIFPSGPGSRAILSAGDVLNLVVSQAATASSQTVEVDVFGDEF